MTSQSDFDIRSQDHWASYVRISTAIILVCGSAVLLGRCSRKNDAVYCNIAKVNHDGTRLWVANTRGEAEVRELLTSKLVSKCRFNYVLHEIVGTPSRNRVFITADTTRSAQGYTNGILAWDGRSNKMSLASSLPANTSQVLAISPSHLTIAEYPPTMNSGQCVILSGWALSNGQRKFVWRRRFEDATISTASTAATGDDRMVLMSLEQIDRDLAQKTLPQNGCHLVVLDTASGQTVRDITLDTLRGGGVVCIANGGRFAAVSDERTLELRAFPGLEPLGSFDYSRTGVGNMVRMTISSDGKFVVFGNAVLYVLDVNAAKFEPLLASSKEFGNARVNVEFAGGGHNVITTAKSGEVQIWNAVSRERVTAYKLLE